MPRHLTDGSVLHPRHERKPSTRRALADAVSVSTGGHAPKPAAPAKRQGPTAFEPKRSKGGVTVSRLDEGGDTAMTPAGRFRIG